MKIPEFKVNTMRDFQLMIDHGDMKIHRAIVDSILKNIKSRKKTIHMFNVKCVEDNETIEITLPRENFVETLHENRIYFESKELYEDCNIIKEAIDTLSNKQLK